MKFFSLIFLMLLIGCEPKETKPELDFVKIDMDPYLGKCPVNIYIDFKNRTLVFSELQYMAVFEKECDTAYTYESTEKSVDFLRINLNDEEYHLLKSEFNNNFLESIKKNNQSLLDNPKKYDGIRFDGIVFELDIVKDNQVFSTDNYLILEKEDHFKILEVLKVVKKHTKSKDNKEYINYLSFYLE